MTSLLLNSGNIQPKTINEHTLTKPDIQLDLYKIARNKGILHPHYQHHLQNFLITSFRQLIQNIVNLEPFCLNSKIFHNDNHNINPPDFNYQTQFLRITLLKLLSYCIPHEQREIFNKPEIHLLIHHTEEYLEIYIRIFKLLSFLDAPDVIMWWFFQVPTYLDFNKDKLHNYKITIIKILDKLTDMVNDTIRFTQATMDLKTAISAKKCLQIVSRGSTYYYNICYSGESNREFISKFNIFLDNMVPDLKYVSPKCMKYYNLDKQIYGINDVKLLYLLELWDKQHNSMLTLQESNVLNSLIQGQSSSLVKKQVSRIKIIFITNKLLNYTSVFRDRIGIIHNLDRRYFVVKIFC